MNNSNKSITELARELRNNPTRAERTLWKHLRKRRLNGYRFLRQNPIIYDQRNYRKDFFIADFYCAEKQLVVEVDGAYHKYQQQYDRNRDKVISALGIEVLRIQNQELQNIDLVKEKIIQRLEEL
ncbi:endonuclease domain-containing protein [Fodinibius sp. Rm-B-1B1-1]|uniref:endonuclease domain-containing protein n=1 Tax=Fodinibius alkaliphilus TaxID=3140241 RepID=UPI0031599839